MPANFVEQLGELLGRGQRSEAVKLFFSKAMGIPGIFVALMRLMPGWSKSVSLAHTLPYDLMIMGDTQTGKPLPVGRWASASMPTLVMTGGKSEAFFHKGAQALTEVLPNAGPRIPKDQHHGSVVMSPKVVASEVTEFFKA